MAISDIGNDDYDRGWMDGADAFDKDELIIYCARGESPNYSWKAYGKTKNGALVQFDKMWRDWCKVSGADPYYWKNGELVVDELLIPGAYQDNQRYEV